MIVLLLVVGLRFWWAGNLEAPTSSGQAAAPRAGAGSATADAATSASHATATIVDDEHSGAADAGNPAAAHSASRDSADLLSAMHIDKPQAANVHRRAAPPRHHPRRRHKDDSDIDILAALMAHVGNGGTHSGAQPGSVSPFASLHSPAPLSPTEIKLQHCPAANTAKGVQCRQKICASERGKDPACPAPMPAGTGDKPDS